MKNIHNHPSRITVLLSTSVILISYTVSLIGVASAAGANGLFGDYFVRMTGPCAAGSVLTGFSQTSGSYGTKTCTPLSNILGDSLGTLFSNSSSTAPTGQAVLGFNTDGTLNFGSVNWNNSGGNISYTEGNVGIGTTAPGAKLEVAGGHGDAKFRLYSSGNGGTLNSSLDMWASEPGVTYDGAGIGNNVNGHPYYGRRNTGLGQSLIRFYQGNTFFANGTGNATSSMAITSGGNVGIGTTSPSNKLHVTGNIGATGWIGAGCEGACEGGGGYSLMYPDGNIVNTAKTTSATLGLANGFEIQQGGSNYGQFNSWVHLNGYYGFYSTYNSAHFYPNDASYGSWKINGQRNGWGGIEFAGTVGNISLMMNSDSVGFHNNSYGWKFNVSGGNAYVYDSTYGGGTARRLIRDGDSSVTFSDVYNNGWFRSNGDTGWYSQTHGGGWYMSDTTWIRSYGEKSVWLGGGLLGSNGGLTVGYGGVSSPSAGAIIAGNVGIGTSSPSSKLQVVGDITANNYYYSSDRKLKKDIKPITSGLEKILRVHGYSFVWKKTGEQDIGVIAQEIEEIFPELVRSSKDENGHEYKTVKYGNLIAPVIEAIKELAAMDDEQITRLGRQENELLELKMQNNLLLKRIEILEKSNK